MNRAIKDFLKVFLLILFALLFYVGIFFLRTKVNPFVLSFAGIALAAGIIIYFIKLGGKKKG
jgi:hypothetical protein